MGADAQVGLAICGSQLILSTDDAAACSTALPVVLSTPAQVPAPVCPCRCACTCNSSTHHGALDSNWLNEGRGSQHPQPDLAAQRPLQGSLSVPRGLQHIRHPSPAGYTAGKGGAATAAAGKARGRTAEMASLGQQGSSAPG